jgi:hypothetical protein
VREVINVHNFLAAKPETKELTGLDVDEMIILTWVRKRV